MDNKEPNIAPIVKEPIKKPLAAGYCKSDPYILINVLSLRTDMYTRE